MVIYVVKPENKNRLDKKVDYEGFPKEFIEDCKKVAYAKFDNKKIAVEFEELDRRYLTTKHYSADYKWVIGYLEIKGRYNQNINERLMDSRLLTLRLRKDTDFRNDYAQKCVDRLEFKIKSWDR
jgi:hypothetical protein